MKVKVESEKVGLKLNIQKTKIMASGPTTSRLADPQIHPECYLAQVRPPSGKGCTRGWPGQFQTSFQAGMGPVVPPSLVGGWATLASPESCENADPQAPSLSN